MIFLSKSIIVSNSYKNTLKDTVKRLKNSPKKILSKRWSPQKNVSNPTTRQDKKYPTIVK